jgi:hypothetical protein
VSVAAAELGVLIGHSHIAAATLMADALDVRTTCPTRQKRARTTTASASSERPRGPYVVLVPVPVSLVAARLCDRSERYTTTVITSTVRTINQNIR